MQIDFSQVLVQLNGQAFTDQDGKTPLTLGAAAVNALLGRYPTEDNLAGTDKLKRRNLAKRAFKLGLQEVSMEEGALIKDLCGKFYMTDAVGAIYDALENAVVVKPELAVVASS